MLLFLTPYNYSSLLYVKGWLINKEVCVAGVKVNKLSQLVQVPQWVDLSNVFVMSVCDKKCVCSIGPLLLTHTHTHSRQMESNEEVKERSVRPCLILQVTLSLHVMPSLWRSWSCFFAYSHYLSEESGTCTFQCANAEFIRIFLFTRSW